LHRADSLAIFGEEIDIELIAVIAGDINIPGIDQSAGKRRTACEAVFAGLGAAQAALATNKTATESTPEK